jgi:hypothetical protein
MKKIYTVIRILREEITVEAKSKKDALEAAKENSTNSLVKIESEIAFLYKGTDKKDTPNYIPIMDYFKS